MSDVFLILAGVVLTAFPVVLIICVINIIRKRPNKKLYICLIVLLFLFVSFETVGIVLACDHEYTLVEEVEATCTSGGQKCFYCIKCEKRKVEKSVPLGHEMVETRRKEPTLLEEGETIITCSRCEFEERVIEQKISMSECSHEWEKATCNDPKSCKICGALEGNALGHEMSIANKVEPSYSENGELVSICVRCGEKLIELIPKIECSHNWKEEKNSIICSICGEKAKVDNPKENEKIEDNEDYEGDNSLETSHTKENPSPSLKISGIDSSKISIRVNADYFNKERLHITVFVKNETEQMIDGNASISFYSINDEKIIGKDTIYFKGLLPGRECWENILVSEECDNLEIKAEFSNVVYTPIEKITADVDSELTEKIRENYYWGFFEASWYGDITDITVYEDGRCVVKVKKQTKEEGQFYAATIWGCGNEHGIKSVQVIEEDGKVLSMYP